MKARNSLVVSCKEKKKTEDCEIVFFNAIAKYFLLTWNMADLRSNGLQEKVMIFYVIMLYYYR